MSNGNESYFFFRMKMGPKVSYAIIKRNRQRRNNKRNIVTYSSPIEDNREYNKRSGISPLGDSFSTMNMIDPMEQMNSLYE